MSGTFNRSTSICLKSPCRANRLALRGVCAVAFFCRPGTRPAPRGSLPVGKSARVARRSASKTKRNIWLLLGGAANPRGEPGHSPIAGGQLRLWRRRSQQSSRVAQFDRTNQRPPWRRARRRPSASAIMTTVVRPRRGCIRFPSAVFLHAASVDATGRSAAERRLQPRRGLGPWSQREEPPVMLFQGGQPYSPVWRPEARLLRPARSKAAARQRCLRVPPAPRFAPKHWNVMCRSRSVSGHLRNASPLCWMLSSRIGRTPDSSRPRCSFLSPRARRSTDGRSSHSFVLSGRLPRSTLKSLQCSAGAGVPLKRRTLEARRVHAPNLSKISARPSAGTGA